MHDAGIDAAPLRSAAPKNPSKLGSCSDSPGGRGALPSACLSRAALTTSLLLLACPAADVALQGNDGFEYRPDRAFAICRDLLADNRSLGKGGVKWRGPELLGGKHRSAHYLKAIGMCFTKETFSEMATIARSSLH